MLTLLRQVMAGAPPFRLVAGDRDLLDLRARATQAVARGDACLLRLQVVQRGVRTGWAGQYDRQTLLPALGRSYELPALVAWESTGVLRYLMSIPDPPADVVRAVEAGVAWLERSKLAGLRLQTFAAEPVRYAYHTSTTDRRLVADPARRRCGRGSTIWTTTQWCWPIATAGACSATPTSRASAAPATTGTATGRRRCWRRSTRRGGVASPRRISLQRVRENVSE